jgi:hypothetical protein
LVCSPFGIRNSCIAEARRCSGAVRGALTAGNIPCRCGALLYERCIQLSPSALRSAVTVRKRHSKRTAPKRRQPLPEPTGAQHSVRGHEYATGVHGYSTALCTSFNTGGSKQRRGPPDAGLSMLHARPGACRNSFRQPVSSSWSIIAMPGAFVSVEGSVEADRSYVLTQEAAVTASSNKCDAFIRPC